MIEAVQEERRIIFGTNSHAAPASEAREVFKQFDEARVRSVVAGSMTRIYPASQLVTFNGLPQDLHGGLGYIREQCPEVFVPLAIVDSMHGNDMVRQFIDECKILIDQPYLEEDEMFETGIDMQIDKGTAGFARFAVTAVFTPLDVRAALGPGHLRPEDTAQLGPLLPDFTSLQTPRERLDGVINLFSSHNEAVAVTCSQNGIDMSELSDLRETNRDLFVKVYKEAGLWTAKNTLYGILIDAAGGGKQNFFTSTGRWDKETIRAGHCPADVLVGTWLKVFGQELAENRDRILTAMET